MGILYGEGLLNNAIKVLVYPFYSRETGSYIVYGLCCDTQVRRDKDPGYLHSPSRFLKYIIGALGD